MPALLDRTARSGSDQPKSKTTSRSLVATFFVLFGGRFLPMPTSRRLVATFFVLFVPFYGDSLSDPFRAQSPPHLPTTRRITSPTPNAFSHRRTIRSARNTTRNAASK